MSIPISSINGVAPTTGLQGAGAAASSGKSGGFASVLEGAIQAVEHPGQQASESIQNFLNGDGEELHNVALSVQKASLAFDLGLQVRNKIVSAYQEVMRMQV
jgi:flagellar hook-basal body complex protein FliE